MLSPAETHPQLKTETHSPSAIQLAALSMIITALMGLYFVNSSVLWNRWIQAGDADNGQKIGSLKPVSGEVRSKPPNSLVWHDLSPDPISIHEGETVFTSTNGTAELVLEGGAELSIAPETLVVVHNGQKAIELERGSITLPASSRDRIIRIKTNDRVLKIKASGNRAAIITLSPAADAKQVILVA